MDPDWAARRPHPALRALVGRYIGYRQRGVTLEVHRGLPSQYLTLIISLAEPIRLLEMPGSAQKPDRWQGFVGGLHTGPALIGQDVDQAGISLQLHPLGARTLLGVPAAELAGRVIDLSELARPGLAELPERLRAVTSWRERFDLVDTALLSAVSRDRPREPPREIGWAWRRLVGSGGEVAIGELAGEVGWSRRHFGELFAREVGLAPKQAARVVRFTRLTAMLLRLDRHQPRTGLAEMAAACGYFDQAHLSNEFRALAGCSPRTWIRQELPFLQDAQEQPAPP
ncbi:MAG TPA: helix-turn-helix domain-containing protein [Pseudonocardia sp.]|jgi:AraC-like DNA-binding protein|nr:helix-turn-helix domain-containing protein [Pseudonocardia sp.]